MSKTNAQFSFDTYTQAMLDAEIQDAKRIIIGAVASIAVAAIGITCGIYVASYLGMAAFVFTGWAFFAIVIEIFTMLLLWAATTVAAHVVNNWITSGNAGLWFNTVGGKIKGLFKRSEESTHLKQEQRAPRKARINGDDSVKPTIKARATRRASVQ